MSKAPTLELVRCGCGLVRNDEDARAPLAFVFEATYGVAFADNVAAFELPRSCRGCGSVYILPKPQPPSSSE